MVPSFARSAAGVAPPRNAGRLNMVIRHHNEKCQPTMTNPVRGWGRAEAAGREPIRALARPGMSDQIRGPGAVRLMTIFASTTALRPAMNSDPNTLG